MVTVLIADDEDLSRYTLRKMIASLSSGLSVVAEAENGREAIALAAETKPDLVLMDIRMPGMNGLDAAEKILLANPNARIVVASAHDDFAYAQKAVNLHLSGYLLKPVREEDFIAVLIPLIAEIENDKPIPLSLEPETTDIASRVRKYLEAADLSKVTLESVAAALRLSPPHLSRTFKASAGMRFVDYLTHIRIEVAKNALLHEDTSVEEIGRSLGYRDAGYFARIFKEAVGLPPGAYRRQQ